MVMAMPMPLKLKMMMVIQSPPKLSLPQNALCRNPRHGVLLASVHYSEEFLALSSVMTRNNTLMKGIDASSKSIAYEFTPFPFRIPSKKRMVTVASAISDAEGENLPTSFDSSLIGSNHVDTLKSKFLSEIKGIDRGIFGVRAEKRRDIENILSEIEIHNPIKNPTQNLDKVNGKWKLLYSTISISGVKKTKLGLREFIKLSDFFQIIDIEENLATNIVQFNVSGLSFFKGELRILASYSILNSHRVEIKFLNSSITPDQLLKLFQKNYDLLLQVFNPEGWLDITYVDDGFRIGPDDKGNIFALEKCS